MNLHSTTVKQLVEDADNFLYVVIGTNRTGKSVTIRNQVIQWKRANPGCLVIGFDPQRRFRDLFDIFITPEMKDWALKMQRMRNCLLVLDDMRILTGESGRSPEGLDDLLYYRCDFNISIICIFHNPSKVLNSISDFATHYFIFFTNAREGKFKDKIPNYFLCVTASAEVNKYVSVYGKGTYDPVTRSGNFPYAFVDGEKQKIHLINMTRDMSKMP